MALIRGRELATDDWQELADDAPAPHKGRFIVSLKRWQAERLVLEKSHVEFGVRIPNAEEIAVIWPDLAARPLLALEFPKSGDGRAFSQARLLRDRFAYRGELRAVGDVLRDQLHYMMRCGFDAFVIRDDQDVTSCLQAFAELDLHYQAAADAQATVLQLRRN